MDMDDIGDYEIPKRSSYIHATFDTDRKEWSAFASCPDHYEYDEHSHYRGTNTMNKKPPACAHKLERSFEDISEYNDSRSGYMPRYYQPDENSHY